MPTGVPVATVAIGGAHNAGLLAVRILGVADELVRQRMVDHQRRLGEQAAAKGARLRDSLAAQGAVWLDESGAPSPRDD